MRLSEYDDIKVKSITGRYVTNEAVLDFLSGLIDSFKIETIGSSVKGRPIKSVTVGHGPNRILMWSQMHGNESTTTKAVLDLLNYVMEGDDLTAEILNSCTIVIIPILSPDGAFAYTRVNANEVDLNRDAENLSQPESVILREVFDSFRPDYAFNLHGQRTIYNVGTTEIPATISFLSPSVDDSRKLTASRKKAMQLIVAMNKMLQKSITGGVGRYDDGFNLNCVGDTFQSLECPTILFEAGHFPDDYEREEVRKLIFTSLLTALKTISSDTLNEFDYEDYFDIPENGKQFLDILIKNIDQYDSKFENGHAVGILFREVLQDDTIIFKPALEHMGALDAYFGHQTYDCSDADDLSFVKNHQGICSVINNI